MNETNKRKEVYTKEQIEKALNTVFNESWESAFRVDRDPCKHQDVKQVQLTRVDIKEAKTQFWRFLETEEIK